MQHNMNQVKPDVRFRGTKVSKCPMETLRLGFSSQLVMAMFLMCVLAGHPNARTDDEQKEKSEKWMGVKIRQARTNRYSY